MISMQEISLGAGKTTKRIVLKNDELIVEVIAYGAHLYRIFTKDRGGEWDNVILNVTPIEAVLINSCHFGSIIGPVAGRIAQGKLDDVQLEQNENDNCLHSGSKGWSWQEWAVQSTYEEGNESGVILSLCDTTSGFANEIQAECKIYIEQNELGLIFRAKSDEMTAFNPTNHAYFNLAGTKELQSIRNHTLMVQANEVLALDEALIPTGEKINVEGTGYDFRSPRMIGDALTQLGTGLDIPFVLQDSQPQLILTDEKSGRRMEAFSDRKAVVLYSVSNFSRKAEVAEQPMQSELGLAIEFQEAPNIQPKDENWPDIVLQPNEWKEKKVQYRFFTD